MRREPATPADILAAIRAPLSGAGATVADAPLLQPLSLLLDLAGEALRSRLFVVQAEGGAEACLRPDFTAAIASRHIEAGAGAGRYIYEGAAFRAARDADRPEEFQQLGLEVFDADDAPVVTGDAEIVRLAWASAAAGGRGDLTLWLGDVGLFTAFLDSLVLAPALAARLKRAGGRPRLLAAELARAGQEAETAQGGRLAAVLSTLSPAEAAELLEEVWALAGVQPVGGRNALDIAQRLIRRSQSAGAPPLSQAQAAAVSEFLAISDTPAAAFARVRELAGPSAAGLDRAIADWDARLKALAGAVPADALRFAPALGHAFDYYDGVTLEVRSEALGADRPIAVGGRYDGLLSRLGASGGARAVGCMVRPWRAFAGGEA